MTYGQLARRVRLRTNLPELGSRDRILHDALDTVSVEYYDGDQNVHLSVVVRKGGHWHARTRVLPPL
jgi:hypothetical protein